jgi:hypothetical protein
MIDYSYNFVKVVTDENGDTIGSGYCTEYSNGELKNYYYSIDDEGNISYATEAPKALSGEKSKVAVADSKEVKKYKDIVDYNLSTLEQHYAEYADKLEVMWKLYKDRKALYESDYLKPANKEKQSELLSAIEVVTNLKKELKDLIKAYKK